MCKNNKMCKKDVQKTTRCAKNNKLYKKEKQCTGTRAEYILLGSPVVYMNREKHIFHNSLKL